MCVQSDWPEQVTDELKPYKARQNEIGMECDAHSKWLEVIMMSSTTAQRTTEALWSIFSHYGLPEQLVSDNGPHFTSQEFAEFMNRNGIKHILCSPYHSPSNGLAEQFVQTFKMSYASWRKGWNIPQPSLIRIPFQLLLYSTCNHCCIPK